MSIAYRETSGEENPEVELETAVLEAITKGRPYVLVVADLSEHPDINLALSVGGGVEDLATAEVLLAKALDAARKVSP